MIKHTHTHKHRFTKLEFASCTWSSMTKSVLQIRYIGKMDRRRFGLFTVTGLRLNTLVVWPSQANEALMKGLHKEPK